MRLHILNKSEKTQIENMLNEQFGIKEIPGILVKRGEERIFLFQGSFTGNQIKHLEEHVPIERTGIYFAKIMEDNSGKKKMRLSIEGTQILQSQITKNIFELNDEEMQQWMQGEDLQIKTGKRDFLIMKYSNDFMGTGKASEDKISNYIPKSRRLKSKSIIK